MKTCTVCNNVINDTDAVCPICGTPAAAPGYNSAPTGPAYAPVADPYDHTAEFDPADISENKVICMCIYLLGWLGILIAAIMSKESPFTAFHIRQRMKYSVVFMLIYIFYAFGWIALGYVLGLGLIAVSVLVPVLFIFMIISFVQVCQGKAKEPLLIRKLTFLK